MRFHSALVYSFLLASASLVDTSQFMSTEVAMTGANNGTFHSVVAAISIPTLSGKSHDSVSAYVSFDSTEACPAGAQIGFQCNIDDSLETSCYVWYGVLIVAVELPESQIYPGDTVVFGITAPTDISNPNDPHGVKLFFESYKTSLNHTYSVPDYKACGIQVAWTVSNTADGSNLGQYIPLADFGRMTFTTATAYQWGGVRHFPLDSMAEAHNMTNADGNLVVVVDRPEEDAISFTHV